MGRRVRFELDLPEDLFTSIGEEGVNEKAREALVMALLRERRISQGKAAELLEISRHTLFDLMTKYQVPTIDLTPEELAEELGKPFPA